MYSMAVKMGKKKLDQKQQKVKEVMEVRRRVDSGWVAEKGNENVKQRWNGPLNQAREVPDACSGCANALPYDPLMV